MILPGEKSPVSLPTFLPHDAMLLYPGWLHNLVNKNPEKVLLWFYRDESPTPATPLHVMAPWPPGGTAGGSEAQGAYMT